MQPLVDEYGTLLLLFSAAIMLFAGFTKGAVGFALPMISVSGIGTLLDPKVAIAALILPALVANSMQALRNGKAAALQSVRDYWRLNLILITMIAFCAQLVVILPDQALFFILGAMVTVFGTLQLIGWTPVFPDHRRNQVECGVGVLAGFFGGLSGVWGPPITLYLLARDVPKVEMVRVLGIAFFLGSIVLLGGHTVSGVFNRETLPFSALLIVPAVIGMILGQRLQDRLPQATFRTLTLLILVIAGLNLLRRGMGY